MPISVENFLRDHPVERAEENDESNSVVTHTRKKISHKSVLLSAKNNTKNMPYVKNAKVSDLSDELCNSCLLYTSDAADE